MIAGAKAASSHTGALAGNETRTLPVTGRGTIPASGVGAVAVNVTGWNLTKAGIDLTDMERTAQRLAQLAPGGTGG